MADGTVAAPGAAPAGGVPGQQISTPAAGQQPGESAAQAQARMLKLALDGQEVEIPESEVVANYRKGKHAAQLLSKVEQRRQEALKAKAAAEGLVGRLKSDPFGVLQELGIDTRGLSEKAILEEIELEKLTPEQRKLREMEKKLKAHETEKQKVERERQEAQRAQEVEYHKDQLANLFLETMEATGLPKSSGRFVMHRLAHLYQQNEEAGLESTPEEMAAYVLQGLKREHTCVLSGLKGQALVDYLGADVVKEILSHHLTQARAKRGLGQQPAGQQRQQPAQPSQNIDPRKGRWAEIEKLMKG